MHQATVFYSDSVAKKDDMSTKRAQFEALTRSLSTDIYRYAVWLCRDPHLAQDLVQETFLRAWRAIDSLRDEKAAKGWLITILRREHARLYERKTPQFTDVDGLDLEDVFEHAPDDRTEVAVLRRAMAQLPDKYREPLILQVIGGYSCEEIAETLEISKSAVMTQLYRARQKLKAKLDGDEQRTGTVHELP